MLKICLRSVNMKLVGVAAILSIFCLTTVMGAPRENLGEESLKQQIASGLLRGGNDDYWNAINQELYEDPMQHSSSQFAIRTRGSLDSLGRGNILRSLDGMGSDWLDTKGGPSWRIGSIGTPKRGSGGLDSLGRGHILRAISNQFQPYQGNILKRSIRSLNH